MNPASAASDKTIVVTNAGAVGDGVTLNTVALQKAIDALSADGGGTVIIPPGRFLTGTIQLKDNITLHLDDQAILLGSTNKADYRNVDPFIDGTKILRGEAMIVSSDAKNVGIEGNGAIDGQGKALSTAEGKYTVRPFLVRCVRCTGVSVKNVTLRNSGAWTLNFFQCDKVTASGVTIRSRGLANNDGIDTDSCQNVKISACDIDTGDDAICLKTTSTRPCRDVTVTDCKLRTSCSSIKIGTETIGDFEAIHISHCQVRDIGMSGIAVYSVDGAQIHDVKVNDITMDGVMIPISVRLGARLKTFRAGDVARPPGTIRDVTIQNVRATGAKRIGLLINGVPGHPIESLTLENIKIEVVGGGKPEDAKVQLAENEATYPEVKMFGAVMPVYGLYVRHIDGIVFKDVTLSAARPDPRPAASFIDAKSLTPADFPNGVSVDSPATTP
ncbi:MAG: glycosyl hydrolase family 28 protein [Planctomycetota bacterium]|nr:glycosyl hydrolase family 28 protein [Planctomycetota bacterium]